MDDLPEIELHPAHFFYCEECGAESFLRTPAVEAEHLLPAELPEGMTAEQIIEIVTGGKCEPGERFLLWPENVTCHECGAKYRVEDN